MGSTGASRLCHLYINSPEHVFDQGLKLEAERVAEELTRAGFPVQVQVRHARGDEGVQQRQIEEDRRMPRHPDLFVIIPIKQDAVYTILNEIVGASADATCVFLHQPLTRMQLPDRQAHEGRLFSVTADQVEIGRIQGRQFAALLPRGEGNVLYVQGRENSYGTRHRMKGVLDELTRNPGMKLGGYRVYGDWSAGSVKPAVEEWQRLGGNLEWIQVAGAQSDDMALALAGLLRDAGRAIPVTGVDGLPSGKRAVDKGVLAATVVQPLGVGHALRVFRDLHSGVPEKALIPEDGNIVLPPESYPPLEELRSRRAGGS